MPKKGSTQEKKAARERQAATGKPYALCLAEIRTEWAAAREQARRQQP